mmetsp:Transcript_7146/g.15480  ORF Transcript_7146/g.15480 Transcript_7146/m.15480 type:complete len:290 (+) Transcript_7146:548-1417(+)
MRQPGHLGPNVRRDAEVSLHLTHPADEVVYFPQQGTPWQGVELLQHCLLVLIEEFDVILKPVLLVPEGADVDTGHLGRSEDLTDIPEECSIHSDEVGSVDLVGLVQHTPDLICVRTQNLHHLLEFIRDVELVRIESEQNQIGPGSHPGSYGCEVVVATDPLLAAREHPWCVDEGDLLENWCRHGQGMEAAEEVCAEGGKALVWKLRQAGGCVAIDEPLLVAVDNGHKLVCAGLRPHVEVGAVATGQPLDHGGLASAVLAQQQHLRPSLELLHSNSRSMKVLEVRALLQR